MTYLKSASHNRNEKGRIGSYLSVLIQLQARNVKVNLQVIDFHTHPYLSDTENTCMYKEAVSLDMNAYRLDLKQAGIIHICGSVIEKNGYSPQKGFDYIRSLNRKALEIKKNLGDFYTPGFHVHPDYVRESCEEIAYMKEHGIKLIGELVPYMHGWSDYSCRGLGEILDYAQECGMIISFHSADDEQMDRMISEHPNLLFVAAHPGEKDKYDKHIQRLSRYENAYLDLSGTGLFRYGMLAYGVKHIGADRILFGSDYPICNPRMYVQAVLQEHISSGDCEKILYKNAARVLGM